jgi:hypothetical protein
MTQTPRELPSCLSHTAASGNNRLRVEQERATLLGLLGDHRWVTAFVSLYTRAVVTGLGIVKHVVAAENSLFFLGRVVPFIGQDTPVPVLKRCPGGVDRPTPRSGQTDSHLSRSRSLSSCRRLRASVGSTEATSDQSASVSSDRSAQDRSKAKPDERVQAPVARMSGRAASRAIERCSGASPPPRLLVQSTLGSTGHSVELGC